MRFLIVVPRFFNQIGKYYNFPLGLAYISSSLKKKGYEVECLNLNHYNESIKILLKKEIKRKNIDIVCTGGISFQFSQVEVILNIAKEIKPAIITISGGGLISSEPELMLKILKIDFGVIGEGEETIVELANALSYGTDLKEINGIIYHDNKNIVMTPPRKEIEDIDSIPWPDYEGFEFDKYVNMQTPSDYIYSYILDNPRELPIIASRSCPYNCTFCYHPIGKKYRQRSLDSFFTEMDYMVKKYDLNIISIYDELFALNKERVKDFCNRIKKYNLKWTCQLRVDQVDREILEMMRDSGCYHISYGLESASDKILKSMKKNITVAQIEHALKLTMEAKIGIQGNFIFSDIAETWETAQETLKWWSEHKEYQIWLIPLQLYPGTTLYQKAVEKGLIKDKVSFIKRGFPNTNLTQMSDKEFKDLMNTIVTYHTGHMVVPEKFTIEKTGKHPYKGDIFTIKSVCPHCHSEMEYKNMSMSVYYTVLGCRECYQRFFILHFKKNWIRFFSFSYLKRIIAEKGFIWSIKRAIQRVLSFYR
jgi:radical SAM superfamily enzyme YgiQ (UPF0313 family)